MDVTVDTLVVGGGTAGGIVAARLSEDPARSVLLLEAGSDYPESLGDALCDPSVAVTAGANWDLRAIATEGTAAPPEAAARAARIARVFEIAARAGATFEPRPSVDSDGVRFPYPMAKVIGGGSAINAALALAARPEDFAAWATIAGESWSWDHVRPEVERLADWLPIEIPSDRELTAVQRGFLDASVARGFGRIDLAAADAGTTVGVGAIPKNLIAGRRASTATLYLDPARTRLNLAIRAHALVDRLLFERARGPLSELAVVGLEAIVAGERVRFFAREVVIAAGAIHSPAILLRSGLGASARVARLGIAPVIDLPGVGENLCEHPVVSLWAAPRAGFCRRGEMVHQVLLQARSSTTAPRADLHLIPLGGLPTERLPPLADIVGADLAIGLSTVVTTPDSRGRVEVESCDPFASPRVRLRLLAESADRERMQRGVRLAWELFTDDRLAAMREAPVVWSQSAIDSERALDHLMLATVRGGWHPVGTLRMGAVSDSMAVVDQAGRVHGVRGLWIADGSILPQVPSVPTNLTCMLVAERVAREFLAK
jgi:choline dehydrogenase